MPETPLLVGIDIGTTSIKAIVFDAQGQIVASAANKTPTHFPGPGRAFYTATELWETAQATLRQVVALTPNPQEIVSLAVTSIGETGAPLDEKNEPVYDMIAWFDTRSEPQAEWLAATIGPERFFRVIGLPLHSISSLCKLLWLKQNQPEAFGRIKRWLHVADYITYRLCGEQATDFSVASRSLMLDLTNMAWADEILREVGVPPEILAPLTQGGTPLAKLLPTVAAATGLPAHTLVTVGGHDHICGAMAIGAIEPGVLLDSIGTAEAILVPMKQPLLDPALGVQGYEMGAHVAGGYYCMPSFRTAGACIEWFRDTCAPDATYADLIAAGEATPPGSLGVSFMPHLRLPHTPSNDRKSRGAFAGLSTDATRGALYRAILEGLCCEARNAMEPLWAVPSVGRSQRILAIGGGTRNRLWMEIKAAVYNQTIEIISIAEETAAGAAILGGLGAGVYANVADALAQLQHKRTLIEPDPALAAYYDRFFKEVFQQMYPSLRPLSHSIYALQHTADHGN